MTVNKTLLPDEEEKDILTDPNAPAIGDAVTGGAAVGGVTNGVTSGVGGIGSTAQPIVALPSYKGEMPDYDTWMSENGYDPDRDYDEAKAALEYDYETSMATYGRRAEELAQMGLSNSGLSDVYQLGAFNTYLKSQNDLANQRIAAKKKYKQEYNALVEQREGFRETDSANAYNFGLSLYDGSNIDFVRQQLTQQGYDPSIIDSAIASLSALDANTLPAVKAQQDKDAADVDSAFQAWAKNYKIEDRDKIANYYRANNWSEDKINSLMDQLDAYAGAAGVEDAAIDQLVADVGVAVPDYDGSEKAKNDVLTYLKSKGLSDYYDQVIAGLGEAAGAEADAVVTDTVNKPVGEVTTDEMADAIDKAEQAYGKDSEEYRQSKETVSEKMIDLFDWALEANEDGSSVRLGSAEVAAALGFDADDWSSKSDADREAAIMDYAGNMHKNGYLSDAKYSQLVSEWITSELNGSTKITDAGMTVYTLMGWRDAGYLTQDEYDARVKDVVDTMQLSFDDVKNRKISWNGDDGEVEVHNAGSGSTKLDNVELSNEIQTAFNQSAKIDGFVSLRERGYAGNIALYAYQGKLYEVIYTYDKNGDPQATSVNKFDSSKLYITKDGEMIATDKEKQGVYELIAYALDYRLHKMGGNSGSPNLQNSNTNSHMISTRQ